MTDNSRVTLKLTLQEVVILRKLVDVELAILGYRGEYDKSNPEYSVAIKAVKKIRTKLVNLLPESI